VRLILDTNVLVSALLSPYEQPAQVLYLILSGKVSLVLSVAIFAEYKAVLARPKFMFDQNKVQELLNFIALEAEFVIAHPLKVIISDPKDLAFIEAASAANVDIIVTGNQKHFPKKITERFGIKIYTPTQFLESLSK
jgi:uncharacterized protein